MNSQDELERMLGQQLHHRVDGMTDAPLGLGDVKDRAGRIQRNRRIAVGVGIAAAVAIIVPTAVIAGSGLNRTSEVPPASEGPTPRHDIRTTLTLDGLASGAAPAVEYFTEDGVVLPGRGLVRTDRSFQALLPSETDGGYIAVEPDGQHLRALTEDFVPQSGSATTSSFVTTPDRAHYAFVTVESGAQTLVSISTTDPDGARTWDFPERPVIEPVGFLSDQRVVFQTTGDGETRSIGIAEVDGTTTELEGRYVKAISVDTATGLLAVQTKSNEDASGCFGVVDTTASTAAPRWETCDYSLGTFSADGQYVLASDPYQSGFGKASLTILDADTGSMVATFQQERGSQIALPQVVWESSTTVLATAQEGPDFGIVRFGTDGTLEAAVEPTQPEDPFGDLPFYFGMDRARF